MTVLTAFLLLNNSLNFVLLPAHEGSEKSPSLNILTDEKFQIFDPIKYIGNRKLINLLKHLSDFRTISPFTTDSPS